MGRTEAEAERQGARGRGLAGGSDPLPGRLLKAVQHPSVLRGVPESAQQTDLPC